MYLLTIICTWNRRKALKKDVAAKSNLVVLDSASSWLPRGDASNVEMLEFKPTPSQLIRSIGRLLQRLCRRPGFYARVFFRLCHQFDNLVFGFVVRIGI